MSALGGSLRSMTDLQTAAAVAADVERLTKAAEPLSGNVVKASEDSRYLLCVVYSANRMPARGADKRIDVVSPGVLEKAAWRFAENGLRVGVDHKPGGETAARVVENSIYRGPDWHITGPEGHAQVVKTGDWLVGMILSPDAWSEYKAGRWSGVSMQGDCRRVPASRSTLARLEA